MKTQLREHQIEQAIALLRRGGLVVFPTDTVYGIGANSEDDEAVVKMYEVKGRPASKAFQLLLSDPTAIASVAREVPEVAWRLVERFFPGPLTLVLKKAPQVSTVITAGGDTVAVRMPKHPIPLAIIRGLGTPLAASSANISGQPSPIMASEVSRLIAEKVDLVIDGGRCPQAIDSTVVDLTAELPRILREGAISRQVIEAICGHVLGKSEAREEGNRS